MNDGVIRNKQDVGRILRETRVEQGLSRKDVATALGHAETSNLAAYELARRFPSIPNLIRMLKELGYRLRVEPMTEEEKRRAMAVALGLEDEECEHAWAQRYGQKYHTFWLECTGCEEVRWPPEDYDELVEWRALVQRSSPDDRPRCALKWHDHCEHG